MALTNHGQVQQKQLFYKELKILMEIKPLYTKDDTMYGLCDGCVFPVMIDSVVEDSGSFYYGINYKMYLEFIKCITESSPEYKVPNIHKGYVILQEDLFKTIKDMEHISIQIRAVVLFLSKIEKETED